MQAYNEKSIALIRKAIGNRTQKEFAQTSGLSQYNITRILTNKYNTSVPRRSTLRMIANASEGRVTYEELLEACGYTVEGVQTSADQEEILKKSERDEVEKASLATAADVCEGLSTLAGSAARYDSLEDFIDTVTMLYSTNDLRLIVISEENCEGKKHKGAEKVAHCMIHFWRGNIVYQSSIYCSIYFCKTENGGYIISDVIYDLQSLVDAKHPMIYKYIFRLSEKDDINYGNFPIAFEMEYCKDVLEKLLAAIFREDEDDDEDFEDDEEEQEDE